MRKIMLSAAAAMCLAAPAAAKPPEVSSVAQASQPFGCARYGWLLANWYDAELWTDAAAAPGQRYALTLNYLTDFSRNKLLELSIDEMVRISGRPRRSFSMAGSQLAAALRDVDRGDRFTAERRWDGTAAFYFNGSYTGALTQDADLFLSIWLGDRTRLPGPRRKLLSGARSDCA